LSDIKGDIKEPEEDGSFRVCWGSCSNGEVADWVKRRGKPEVEWGWMKVNNRGSGWGPALSGNI